ncbi:EpsG family protein [Vibrio coralliirubri]|uniref:EpsG family protein n=1 Tax=Vibrio coralliirubri TaxID=1516159 RepID=UPI0006348D89|nr:conserved membrane hypothetical protein [Vibrio coralliirubri]
MFEPETYRLIYIIMTSLLVMYALFERVSFYQASRSESIQVLSNVVGCLFFLIWFWVVFGFRPVHSTFSDMVVYAYKFEMASYSDLIGGSDVGWQFITNSLSKLVSVNQYFSIILFIQLISIFIYVYKDKSSTKILLLSYIFLNPFLFTNLTGIIRNGLAISLVLIGLTYSSRIRELLFFLAITIHASVLLPISVFYFTFFSTNYKRFELIWFVTLIFSYFGLSNFLLSPFLPYFDDRLLAYVTLDASTVNGSNWGFRWDFIVFSVIPMLFSRWSLSYRDSYLLRRNYCIYILCNSFWILMISVPFSDRFAHLSWFLYGILLYQSTNNIGRLNSKFRILNPILHAFNVIWLSAFSYILLVY